MKYYYITGTSKGIGKGICEAILEAEPDARAIGIARSQTIEHPNYQHLRLDLSIAEQAMQLQFEPHEDAERIVLINNAGTLGEVDHLGKLNNEVLNAGFQLNLNTPAILMNNFINAYQEQSCERLIINISTGAAKNPYDGWALYSSSKAGLDMLTRVAALEQSLLPKQKQIRVLAVAPGVVATDMQQHIRSTDETGFSNKQKFIRLKEENQLYDAKEVGRKYLEIIQQPQQIEDTISRISL